MCRMIICEPRRQQRDAVLAMLFFVSSILVHTLQLSSWQRSTLVLFWNVNGVWHNSIRYSKVEEIV